MRIFVSACALGAVSSALAACGGDSYLAGVRVSILNDTSERVMAYLCSDEACSSYRGEGVPLDPGDRTETLTDDQATPNPVKFAAADGRVIGCLPLILNGRPENEPVTVPVSQAIPCRESYS